MSFLVDVSVPITEEAPGFGHYPRALAALTVATLDEARAVLSRNQLTWLGALHDHEQRFEGWVFKGVRRSARVVLCRSVGRDEIVRERAGQDLTRALRAEHGLLFAAHGARHVIGSDLEPAVLNGHNPKTKTK